MNHQVKEEMYKLLMKQISQVKGHIESLEDILNENLSHEIKDFEAGIELESFGDLFVKKASSVKQTIEVINQLGLKDGNND